jgi:hypothetical protein
MVGVGFAFCVGGGGVAVGVGETVDEQAVMTSIPPMNMHFLIFCTFPPQMTLLGVGKIIKLSHHFPFPSIYLWFHPVSQFTCFHTVNEIG